MEESHQSVIKSVVLNYQEMDCIHKIGVYGRLIGLTWAPPRRWDFRGIKNRAAELLTVIMTMNAIPCTPTIALRNLCLLLQVLVNSNPSHVYRNALVYGAKSSGDEIVQFLTNSLGDNLPWMYYKVDSSKSVEICDTVRSSTINFMFLQDLQEISLVRRIKRKAAHTVIILNNSPQNRSEIEKTMKILKRYSIPNVALILWRNSIEIWTANHFREMYSILVFSSKHHINFNLPPNLHELVFFPKTNDLHGAGLDVFGYSKPPKMVRIPNYLKSIFPGVTFGGRDGFLAHSIAAKLNAKLNYSISQVHNLTRTASHAVQFVDNLNHDVFKFHKKPELILMSSYSELYSTDYELLQPHEMDCVAIVIPSNGKPLLIGIREVLSIPIVKLSPIILILVVIVWYLILIVNKPRQMDGTKVILDTLGIYLRTKSISCPKTASEKILIMSLFIFTIIMGGLFAEFVYNNLVKPPFDRNIDSLEELADTGLNIWAEKYVMDYLQEYSDKKNGRIQEMIVVKDRPEIIDAILAKNFSQGYALLHSTVDMYLKNKDMYEHGENVYHKLSECVIPIQVAFKIIQFSLLRETINEMLLKFLQWGFFQNFRRLEADLLHRMNISHEIPTPPNEHVAFTLDMTYFLDIFIFLICGLFVSFMVFICEISVNYYMNKIRQKKTK